MVAQPVIPATLGAEAGESLEPRRRAEVVVSRDAPLHSSSGNSVRIHLKKQQKGVVEQAENSREETGAVNKAEVRTRSTEELRPKKLTLGFQQPQEEGGSSWLHPHAQSSKPNTVGSFLPTLVHR